MQRLTGILLLAGIIVLAGSCGNVKNLQYVQGAFDTTKLSKIQFTEPVIQKGDLLSITVFSDDAKATAAVMGQPVNVGIETNSSKTLSVSGAGITPVSGFLVNQDGAVRLYKLGLVQAEGKTRKQLADTLAQLYVQLSLLQNPYVDIQFLNFKVTLVGEVMRPGTYAIPTDKVSIFEAISLAGDITIYGKRNNVMVVRESNNVRQFVQLDLSKPEVFASPYYYLQQNDMVIVDVAKNKAAVSDQTTMRNITVTASILATIAIFINIFK